MSVLIKGMEMPTSCGVCRFNGAYCYAKGDEDAHSTLSCPLVPVPPHGDLIDRKQLIKPDHQHYEYMSDEFYITVRDVEAAPTIIPAEGGE